MSFADALLPEFDNEMKTTRAMLERVPFGADTTKPNTKSRTLHELASHIANIVRFGEIAANSNERDFSAPGALPPQLYNSSEELLKVFDTNVAASRAAIEKLDDSRMGDTFTLRRGQQVMFAVPRATALRTLLMSHVIHHRGQLSAYFRLNEVPHPPIYGPTAEMQAQQQAAEKA